MMKPKEIVRSFIEQKLDGDIERLEMFKLGSLFYDKTYGCPGRKFDSDDK